MNKYYGNPVAVKFWNQVMQVLRKFEKGRQKRFTVEDLLQSEEQSLLDSFLQIFLQTYNYIYRIS